MVGDLQTNHEFLVAKIENDGVLGLDFLYNEDCQIDVRKQSLTFKGGKNQLRQMEAYGCRGWRVTLAKTMVVPSRHEMVIDGEAETEGDWEEKAMFEVSPEFNERHAVNMARTLVDPTWQHIPLLALNLRPDPVILYKGTTLGRMFPVHPQGIHPLTDLTSLRTMRKNPQPNSKDLPGHLQKLWEESTEQINAEEGEALQQLLLKYQDAFSTDDTDLGRCKAVTHKIDTGMARPIKQPVRRLPIKQREIADQQVEEMLKRGVIEPSHSPWASPITLVQKKSGEWRFCIDFRRLNEVTRKDAYPLPRIDEALDSLGNAKWFCTMDMASGYWQIAMHPEDKEKTAFCTRKGLFQFTVMPYGGCNSAGTFTRCMEMVLAGLQHITCLIYIDDIIVFGKDFNSTLQRLEDVLGRLQGACLKVKPKKCRLFQRSVKFLGHVVSEEGIAPDQDKVNAVLKWPRPVNLRELRSFVGFISYYRRFIKGFAEVARPLNQLTEKSRPYDGRRSVKRLL